MHSLELIYYPSGALYAQISTDRRQYYYENGPLKTLELYREGRLDGLSLLYHPNGQLKRSCSFLLGIRHGLDQIWNEEAVLVDVGFYQNGDPVGVHRRWSSKGALIEEIVYWELNRFDLRRWSLKGEIEVEALWVDSTNYKAKAWDRFQNVWVEQKGVWDGKKLIYV